MSIMLPGYKPQKQKVDPLDKIVKGLQIAQSAFGIYADYEKINQAQEARDNALAQQNKENETRDLTNAKIKAETTALERGKNVTPGSVRDVKYMLGGKPYMTTLGPNDRLPEGATPYEDPKPTPERKEGSGGKFTRDDVRYWDESIGKFRTQKNVVAAEEYYSAAATVEKLADLKSSQADNQIATLMNKLARDNSAPGGDQMKGAGASENLVNKFESLKQRFLTERSPKLTDEDRQAIKDIATLTKQLARIDYTKAANTWALDRSKVSDMTQAEILQNYLDPEKTLSFWDAEADVAREQLVGGQQGGSSQPSLRPGKQFYSPQGAPYAQQQRSKQVDQSWGQRIGVEAGAAPTPTPQPSVDIDSFIKRNRR